MATSLKKHISLSKALLQLANIRSKQFGITIPEYIRFLIMNDTKIIVDKTELISDIETIESIGSAVKDIDGEKYDSLKTDKDIDKFINQASK